MEGSVILLQLLIGVFLADPFSISSGSATQATSLTSQPTDSLTLSQPSDLQAKVSDDSATARFHRMLIIDAVGTSMLGAFAYKARSPILGGIAWGFLTSFPLLYYGRPVLAVTTMAGGIGGGAAGIMLLSELDEIDFIQCGTPCKAFAVGGALLTILSSTAAGASLGLMIEPLFYPGSDRAGLIVVIPLS